MTVFSDVYLGSSQVFIIDRFVKIVYGIAVKYFHKKSSIVDNWQGPKYAIVLGSLNFTSNIKRILAN